MSARREFLKGVGGLTAGAVATRSVVAAPAGADRPRRYAMVVDLRKCIGCQACTVACAYENQVPVDRWRTVVAVREVRTEQGTGALMLPQMCNHCDEPPCVKRCPADATYKTADGSVQIDADRCIGCGRCVRDCPYGARFINDATDTAEKCSFCMHRVAAGLLPGCVETCVGGARVFGDLNDPSSAVRQLVSESKVQVLKPEKATRPHVFYLGLDAALAAGGRALLADPRQSRG